MNNHSDPLLALHCQDDQHRNKTPGVLCEIASKVIKLDSVPDTPVDGDNEHDNNKENTPELEEVREIQCDKNPLLFVPVLSELFSKMDVETLKNARQVCNLWNDESLSIFKEKTKAVLRLAYPGDNLWYSKQSGDNEICLKFLNVMNEVGDKELPFDSLCISRLGLRCEGRMSEIFLTYGSKLTFLDITFSYCEGDDSDPNYDLFKPEDLKLILLYWCKNLKTLKLSNLPLRLAESTENIFSVKEIEDRKSYVPGGLATGITKLVFEDRRQSFPLGKMMIFHLFQVSTQLSSIEIAVHDKYAYDPFMDALVMARTAGFLKNLNSLVFGGKLVCHFYDKHLVSLIEMKLHGLRRLEINKGKDLSVESIRKLLHQCKDSLEVFRLNAERKDKLKYPSQFLYLPVMKNLKHLEINCYKIQLSEDDDLVRQFPKLKICTFVRCCSCSNLCSRGRDWSSITLTCSPFTYFDHPKDTMHPILFNYNARCVRIYHGIRKWFPTAISLYANKGEDHRGLVKLFSAMSETNIQELYFEVSCPKCDGISCCPNESAAEEEEEFDKLLQRSKTHAFAKVEKESDAAQIFPELWKLSIVSNGCRNIHLDSLRQLGILYLVENSPVLSEFTIKYCFKTSSKTAVIFDHQLSLPLLEAGQ